MAFKQYNEAPVVENLTGEEKVYINDGNSFKQASIKDIVAQGSKKNDYLTIKKIKDYLFETHYGVIDYGNAYAYFASLADPIDMGFCSAVRNGNWYGRNLDWIYDNNAEFIVHTPHIAGRYASLAVAGGFAELTNDFVTSEAYSDFYKLVPFRLYDGINEYGVIMNMNVVPTDNGTNVSLPTEQEEVTISAQMLIRYVLDNFKTASEAVEYIQKHMKIYFPISLHNKQYELHFMIADENNTYVVEFVDNAAVVFDATENSNSIFAGKPYMTNFYLNGVTLNDDGTVYTPGTQTADYNAKDTNGITDCGAGLERYNYIVDAYDSANTKDGMRAMMNGLKYTRAYSTAPDVADPVWLTEYVGAQGLTVISDPEDFDVVVQYAGGMFNDRSRTDGLTWQTVHSAVYDIENRALNIIVQEDGEELEFVLDGFEKKDAPVELPDELENAIATGGIGWTSEQEIEGFDITWDGDTEGLENLADQAYKVASSVEGIDAESVIGATMVYAGYSSEVTADKITPSGDNVLMISDGDIGGTVIVVSEDSILMDMPITKGVWFFKSVTDENGYVSRLYKEASTEEVVHQIDEKYLPETTSPELINAMNDGGLGWSREIPKIDIHWDGNTDGLVSLSGDSYRLSDVVLHPEDTDGIRFTYDGKTYIVGDNASIYVDSDDEEFKEYYGADALWISIVRDDFNRMGEDCNMAYIVEGLPESPDGIYLSHFSDLHYVSSFYRPASFSNVLTKIDSKYLVEGGHGYTTVEDSGFDIQWSQYDDLDRYEMDRGVYLSKVSNFIPDLSNLEDVQLKIFGITFTYGASEDDGNISVTTDEDLPGCYLLNVKKTSVEDRNGALIIVPEPTEVNIIYGLPKGIYYESSRNVGDDCRFYKPSNPQEVVHKIDEKYIPQVSDSTLENAKATGGIGWTTSSIGEAVVPETVYTSDDSGNVCTTGLDIETPCVTYPDPGQMLCVCNGVECDVEVGYGHNDEYDENFYFMNITHDGEQVLYLWQLEGSFYVINGNTPQPNQTVDFVIYAVDNEVHKIAEKYMPEKVSNAIETGGFGWAETGEENVFEYEVEFSGTPQGDTEFYRGVADNGIWTFPFYHNDGVTYSVFVDGNKIGEFVADNVNVGVGLCNLGAVVFGYPLYLVIYNSDEGRIECYWNEPGVHTFKVTKPSEVVHQIDEKYIPQEQSGNMVVRISYDEETETYSCDKTFSEIAAKYPKVVALECWDEDASSVYYVQKKDYSDLAYIEFQDVYYDTREDENGTRILSTYLDRLRIFEDDSVTVVGYSGDMYYQPDE